MKLLLASLVHLLIAAGVGGGIYLLAHGKPGLLIGSVAVYALVFGKVGCAAH